MIKNLSILHAVQLASLKGVEKMLQFWNFPLGCLSGITSMSIMRREWGSGNCMSMWMLVLGRNYVASIDYEEAMKRLRYYYGDPLKVARCCMEEVTSPKSVAEGKFNTLQGGGE